MPNIFWCLHSHTHYLISKFCVLSCCSFSFLFISFFHLQSFQFNLILQKLKRKNFCDMFSDNPPVTVTVRDGDLCGSDESWVREKHLLDDEIMKLSPIQASRFNIKIACRACQRASSIKRKWKEAMNERIQNKQHSDEEEAFLVQQNQATQLSCSNNILQTSEAFDVLSREDPGDQGVQNKQQRGDGVIELPWSNDILQIVEFEGEMESLPEDSLTFVDEQCLSILDEILERGCTEDPDDEGFQNNQQRAGKETLFVQQKQAIELSCSNDILKIVLLWMLLMIIH